MLLQKSQDGGTGIGWVGAGRGKEVSKKKEDLPGGKSKIKKKRQSRHIPTFGVTKRRQKRRDQNTRRWGRFRGGRGIPGWKQEENKQGGGVRKLEKNEYTPKTGEKLGKREGKEGPGGNGMVGGGGSVTQRGHIRLERKDHGREQRKGVREFWSKCREGSTWQKSPGESKKRVDTITKRTSGKKQYKRIRERRLSRGRVPK